MSPFYFEPYIAGEVTHFSWKFCNIFHNQTFKGEGEEDDESTDANKFRILFAVE